MRVRAVITAGGTTEPIDDVRGVTNVSTGRFGAALARSLAARGVDVTVIGSAMALLADLPPGVRTVPFRTTADLDAALEVEAERGADLVLMAAAVSDYAPVPVDGKIRSDQATLQVNLAAVPKLLPTLRARFGPDTTIVGFKLLSGVSAEALEAAARRQQAEAGVDAVVANDLAELHSGQHPVWWVTDRCERLEGGRDAVADALADRALAQRLPEADLPGPILPGPVTGRLRRWLRLPAVWSPPLPPGPPGLALASCTRTPWRPVALREGRAAWLGAGELDLVRLGSGWSRARARLGELGGTVLPVVDDGQVVAAACVMDGAVALVSTGCGDDDVWPQRVLPAQAVRTPWVPEEEAHAWTDRGFAVVDRRPGWLVVLGPWDRVDAVQAASACLVHRASRTVLVGERLRGPSTGGVAFPGGRVEAGEAPLDAARRELLEETGLVAPGSAPEWTVRTWRGRSPTWEVHTPVWRVAERLVPTRTDELHAAWRDLDAVADDPTTLPGVRAVLTTLRLQEDWAWTPP